MQLRGRARDGAALVVVMIGGTLAWACSPEHATQPAIAAPVLAASTASLNTKEPPLRLNEFRTIQLETYDGSGRTVHPDFVRVSTPEFSGRFLVLTPYVSNSPDGENPAFYESRASVHWHVPTGTPNPLATTDETHLSDPDIVYDPKRAELMVYFRRVGELHNSILVMRSPDGVQWTEPTVVATAPNHELVSPSVVRRSETDWLMWAVNAGHGCTAASAHVELRRSQDGLTWSEPEPVTLDQPGVSPWHIDVQWIPSREEYWAVYPVKLAGSCTTPALYLATSRDGVTWQTYTSPVLARFATPALRDIVYRSTFAYDAGRDEVTFWYSGARYDGTAYVWSTVAQRVRRADLFARLGAPSLAALTLGSTDIPPLRNPP